MGITRRRLLKGLSVAPVVAAGAQLFGGYAKAELSDAPSARGKSESSAAARRHINVVLHGMAIVNVPDPSKPQMEILIPNVTGHEYKWGLWRQEEDNNIPGNGVTLDILGIEGGLPSLQAMYADDNAVMKHGSVQSFGQGDQQLHCRIRLPFPEQIYSLRKVCRHDHTSPFLYDDADFYLDPQPTTIAMVHAFRYSIDEPANVSYGGIKLPINAKETDVNLHIWADPAVGFHTLDPKEVALALGVRGDKRQPQTAFEKMVMAFTGLQFTQCPDYWARSGELSVGEQMPSGMHHYEKYTRSERMNDGWRDGDPPQIRPCTYEEGGGKTRIVHCMALFAYGS
jgi:hypothetical protein